MVGYGMVWYGMVGDGRVWMCGYGPTSSSTPATECQGRGGESCSSLLPHMGNIESIPWIIETILGQASTRHCSKSRRVAGPGPSSQGLS